jgi:hypothetical protein
MKANKNTIILPLYSRRNDADGTDEWIVLSRLWLHEYACLVADWGPARITQDIVAAAEEARQMFAGTRPDLFP